MNEADQVKPILVQRAPALATIIGCVVVVLACVIAIFVMKQRQPEAKKVEYQRKLPMVEVFRVEAAAGLSTFQGRAVVESRRVVTIAAEVTGRVLEISPNWKVGGRIQQGEVIARIDDADYAALQAKAAAAVAQAEEVLALETTQAEMSLAEWRRVSKAQPSPLTAREPQLNRARALIASARAELERAARDFSRTRVIAPFSGRVRAASIEVGSIAAMGMPLGELYSDRILEMRVPIRQKDTSDLDHGGSATVHLDSESALRSTWQAKLVSLDGEIDRATHTVDVILHLLVAESQEPPPVGAFVSVALPLRAVADQYLIPRQAVLDGDHVNIVNAANEIERQPITVVRGDAERAQVSGLKIGQRICLTRLSSVMPRMQVRTTVLP